jgi:hypothetical protein
MQTENERADAGRFSMPLPFLTMKFDYALVPARA